MMYLIAIHYIVKEDLNLFLNILAAPNNINDRNLVDGPNN